MTMERYREIIEKLPIEVNVHKRNGYYTLTVKPMSMSYETFNEIGLSNQRLTHEQWEYHKECYPKDETLDIRRKYQNDVEIFQYDYQNGEASFTASTYQDVENWFKLHSKFVTKKS